VPLVAETRSGVTPIPAEPRSLAPGKVPLATPVPTEAPVSKPGPQPALRRELKTDDPSMDNTPLPPPMIFDDTARHPLAEPMRDGLGLKLLHAEERPAPAIVSVSDSMSMAFPAPAPKPKRITARSGPGAKTKKPVRRYRVSQDLQIAPDPMPAPSFGDGILAKPKKPLPWPVIGGIALVLLVLVFLLSR